MANPLQTPTLLAAGQTLGGCRVGRLLGRGGMGEVYLAHHLGLDKPVAIKVLPPNRLDDQSVERFLKEARVAAHVEHPNVVTIHDVSQHAGQYFIVMQFVEGKNLAELLEAQGGPLPWRTALAIIRQAAKGLAAVHSQGLIHRDIKPANIMVSQSRRVLLMDFGLVREERQSDLTTHGAIVGTPAYMSPEQCRGEPLDKRSDVFALGGTLYTLLTAKLPYHGPTTQGVMLQIAGGKPPRPVHEINAFIPARVSSLVSRMMAAGVRDRLADADAVVREISSCLAEADAAVRPQADTHQISHTPTIEPPIDASLAPLLLIEDDESPQRTALLATAAVAAGLGLVLLAFFLHWVFDAPKLEAQQAAKDSAGAGKLSADDEPVPRPAAAANMIWIPPGEVQIGDAHARLREHVLNLPVAVKAPQEAQAKLDAWPTNGVERRKIPGFWIDRYEATNREYAAFISATGRAPPSHWMGDIPPAGILEQPVTHVTRDEAEAYARWAGKLLPTEAQWMRAFRGDGDAFYPWGDVPNSSITNVYESPAFRTLSNVNATPDDRSLFGVCNLVGNAREMVRDIPEEQRKELTNGQGVLLKGADCFATGEVYGIASYRLLWVGAGPEGDNSRVIGFRCVVEP